MSKDFCSKQEPVGDLTVQIAGLSPVKRALRDRRLKTGSVSSGEGRNPLTPASSIVAIQPQGSKSPFFCVHHFFGECFLLRESGPSSGPRPAILRATSPRARLAARFRPSGVTYPQAHAAKLIKEIGDLFRWSERHRVVALAQ
jgi:hypothetical protein